MDETSAIYAMACLSWRLCDGAYRSNSSGCIRESAHVFPRTPQSLREHYSVVTCRSAFSGRVPLNVIRLQLCAPKVVGI
jgi:hypothetical protein